MAIEKVVKIKVDKKDADLDIQKLNKAIDNLAKSQEEANEQAKKSSEEAKKKLEEQKKATENARKPLNKLKAGFKGLGTAIKATGIGLIIGLVAKLTQSISGNNKVLTFFNQTMIGLNKVFNDLFEFVFANFGKWTKFLKESFENPSKTLKNLGEAIKENLIERFNSLLDTIGILGKALKQVFEGDFKGAIESAKEAGKEFVDVYTGVDGSFDKISDSVEKGANAIAEYAKETVNASKKINELRSSFSQIENQQTRLREAADRDAEAQRRLRDDFTKNLDVRIKANDELAEVLNRQETAEKASVQARINGLNTEQKLLGFKQDRQNEIFSLQTELIAIEAQQAGFRAEQEANAIALQKERIDLEQTALDAQKERQLDQLEFDSEQEEFEASKIVKLQERLELENQLLLEDLERKKEIFAEGTQARVDAEQEYLTAKQELDQKEIELEERKQQVRLKTFDDLQMIAGKETALGKALLVVKQGIALKELLLEAKKTLAFSKLSLAKSTTAVAEGTAQTAKVGFPQNIPLLIGYAAQAAGIIGAIKSATSSANSVASEFGSSGGGSSQPAISAPSFNLVEGTGTDQIADTIQNQDRPIKAFVVSSDVTSQQELDRNAVESATL